MKFAFPISKTEKLEDGRLLIEGVATSEALDLQGEILDYEGSKRAFQKWAGNIREAHDPKKPVGKALEVIPDDSGKTISVRAFISAGAKDTQAKVEDGTLSMFSVGGGAPTKTKMEKVGDKPVRRVLDWPMTELSLVDVGANPDACVSVAKAVGAGETEDEEKPPVEGEEPPPEKKPEPEAEPEPEPEPKEDEPDPGTKSEAPQLTEAQMVELVTKVTDAVLAAMEAKEKAKAEQPPETPKPEEKAADAPGVRKDEEADVLCAASILDSLKNLRVAEGTEPEIETKQLAALARAASALAEFIALEAGEVIANAEAPMPEAEAVMLAARIDGLEKALLERLDSISKSAPTPDPRMDEVVAWIGSAPANIASELSKTASDLKAAFSGEVKALREGDVARLAKGMEQILSMPVPGRAPLRNMTAAAQLVEKSAPTAIDKANVLRAAAQGAPAQVRDYLLHEAVAIERS